MLWRVSDNSVHSSCWVLDFNSECCLCSASFVFIIRLQAVLQQPLLQFAREKAKIIRALL